MTEAKASVDLTEMPAPTIDVVMSLVNVRTRLGIDMQSINPAFKVVSLPENLVVDLLAGDTTMSLEAKRNVLVNSQNTGLVAGVKVVIEKGKGGGGNLVPKAQVGFIFNEPNHDHPTGVWYSDDAEVHYGVILEESKRVNDLLTRYYSDVDRILNPYLNDNDNDNDKKSTNW